MSTLASAIVKECTAAPTKRYDSVPTLFSLFAPKFVVAPVHVKRSMSESNLVSPLASTPVIAPTLAPSKTPADEPRPLSLQSASTFQRVPSRSKSETDLVSALASVLAFALTSATAKRPHSVSVPTISSAFAPVFVVSPSHVKRSKSD